MNNIRKIFSIKDLENFSGIKSHTLRIWEKRYGLLKPFRTDSNIRYYDEDNFIKLLNITLLYNEGIKISKIAAFSEAELTAKVKEFNVDNFIIDPYINTFVISMLHFDVDEFNNCYNELLSFKTFREIFYEVFIPLLDRIGTLWQTKSIFPAHEHFISNLIMQKIHANIEQVKKIESKNDQQIYVLFLPLNEIHELGLLYLNYELTVLNKKTIYLGKDIEVDHLIKLKAINAKIHFISYFTVEPNELIINQYLENLYLKLIKGTSNKFSFLGKRGLNDPIKLIPNDIAYFLSIPELLKVI